MSEGKRAEFYGSQEWKKCRENYKKMVGGLCEICKAKGMITPAEIVHHKTFLTTENLSDPTIALSFDNLQAVCRVHHEEIHGSPKRYRVDESGQITIIE